jgi:hypothetical protein
LILVPLAKPAGARPVRTVFLGVDIPAADGHRCGVPKLNLTHVAARRRRRSSAGEWRLRVL